jgi:hypothetical protein
MEINNSQMVMVPFFSFNNVLISTKLVCIPYYYGQFGYDVIQSLKRKYTSFC